jgi:hypothetical protein
MTERSAGDHDAETEKRRRDARQHALGYLHADVERRGITRRFRRKVQQQLAASIAKDEIVGIARRASSPRGVGCGGVNAIGQFIVEIQLRRELVRRSR